jgi:hypothetical protein
MPITTTLVQDDLSSAELLVVSDTPIVVGRYELKVIATTQTTIGVRDLGSDAKLNVSIPISTTPTSFPIPIKPSLMQNGMLCRATLILYSTAGDKIYTTNGLFYYDARIVTVDPVAVNCNFLAGSARTFSHPNPVVRLDGVSIDAGNQLFQYIAFDNVDCSCTQIVKSGNSYSAAIDSIYLGRQSYVAQTNYNWAIDVSGNNVPSDSAYDLSGTLSIKMSAAVLSEPSFASFVKSTFTFGFDFVNNEDTICYELVNPSVTITLGDVVGVVSENPIKILINNFDSYANFKFTSVTVKIRATADVSTVSLFAVSKQYGEIVSNNKTVIFSAGELNYYATNNILTNGTTYYIETVLNFDDGALFKPSQQRSVMVADMFKDRVDPVTVARAVNSWTFNPATTDGLVVSFKKTTQFMGSTDVSYNLDKHGVTTVIAEYNVLDASGNLTAWLPFSGGYIAQGDMSSIYTQVQAAASSTNTDGRYVVPKHTSSSSDGSQQDDVNIYAVIPNQAQHNLVNVRLSLQSDHSIFDINKRTSNSFVAPAAAGYTYPFTASVRFFPKPAAHNFSTDKPFATNEDTSNYVYFTVPVSVPAYFTSNVWTTGGNTNGTPQNYNRANLLAPSSGAVNGLQYYIPIHNSFSLMTRYEYNENTTIVTDTVTMNVTQQGFPKNETTINYVRWNKDTQKVEYEVIDHGPLRSQYEQFYRMDGWNVYTKLNGTDDSTYVLQGNVLKTSGLTKSLTLSGVAYPDYSIIDLKVVSTRSIYLDSSNTTSQTETVNANKDVETRIITKLPSLLPKPVLADITLSNIVYDVFGSVNQYATLTTRLTSAIGVRITDLANSSTSTDTSFTFALSSAPVTKNYNIAYRYNSYVTGTLTIVYSDEVALTIKPSASSASVPVIVRKSYVDASTFTLSYTSTDSSTVGDTAVLTQKVMVEQTVPTTDVAHVANRSNAGSVNLSGYKGKYIKMFIRNVFSTTYTFGAETGTVTQDVDRAGVSFQVAANPAIVESSFEVKPTPNTITFDVRTNGAPFLNNVLLISAQDATTDDSDLGRYAVAMFAENSGFVLNVPVSNTLNGAPAHTLTVTAITGSGYDQVTSFKFQAASDISLATANIVAYVSNAIEGADSFAVSVTPS